MQTMKSRIQRSPLKKQYDEIRRFAQHIVELYNPEKIILFGSFAYGQVDKDSDVDMLVIINNDRRPVQTAFDIRNRIPCSFPLDLMVRSMPELEKRVQMGDFFFAEILEKGRILYERAG